MVKETTFLLASLECHANPVILHLICSTQQQEQRLYALQKQIFTLTHFIHLIKQGGHNEKLPNSFLFFLINRHQIYFKDKAKGAPELLSLVFQ